jgi:hypothetical protein
MKTPIEDALTALAAMPDCDDDGMTELMVAEAREALVAMREELQDWRDSALRASAESCNANEKHCTCVPVLRVALATSERWGSLREQTIGACNARRSRLETALTLIEQIALGGGPLEKIADVAREARKE